MRWFAVFFVLVAMVLVVSAAPKNVPQYDPQAAAEFNSQQTTKRSLQEAVHQWLNPDKVHSFATHLVCNTPQAPHLTPFFAPFLSVFCPLFPVFEGGLML